MLVHVNNEQSDVSLNLSKIPQIIAEVLQLESKRCDEIAVHFVDTAEICRLHQLYFNDPSTTDCITLPLDSPDEEGYCILGDIFVCPKTAKDYISKHGGDLFEEISLYVIHGVLHLLDYDDIDEDEEILMRAAERRHMENLREKRFLLSSGSDK